MLLKQNKTCVQLDRHFYSMCAKQAADEKKQMSQLCESYACEHEEETETAEEDKQTFHIRIMEISKLSLLSSYSSISYFNFKVISLSNPKHLCNHDPGKNTQVRTLYLEMTLQTRPYLSKRVDSSAKCVCVLTKLTYEDMRWSDRCLQQHRS